MWGGKVWIDVRGGGLAGGVLGCGRAGGGQAKGWGAAGLAAVVVGRGRGGVCGAGGPRPAGRGAGSCQVALEVLGSRFRWGPLLGVPDRILRGVLLGGPAADRRGVVGPRALADTVGRPRVPTASGGRRRLQTGVWEALVDPEAAAQAVLARGPGAQGVLPPRGAPPDRAAAGAEWFGPRRIVQETLD